MSCGIYLITNETNNKVYIGQSVNIEKRFSKHKTTGFNINSTVYEYPLYRAIRKYGLENFSFRVLELCLKDELNEKEIFWIDYYSSFNPDCGYNQTVGGSFSFPSKLSLERANKIKDILIHTQRTQEDIGVEFGISQVTVGLINLGHCWRDEALSYPLRQKKEPICSCGNLLGAGNRSGVCKECADKNQQKVERPSKTQLEEELRASNFSQVAKKYNVSDNAIRKWCDSYNLPRTASFYKK